MAKNNSDNDSSGYKDNKTIEELAREAMDAIKESEQNEERKLEREHQEQIKAKEQALKQEAEQKIKRKLRRLEKEEAEKPKVDEVDTRYMVTWTNPDGVGRKYIGEYEEENTFTITRGIYLFHLNINGKGLIFEDWRKNAHTSISLDTLKSKADKILKESKKAQEKKEKEEKAKKEGGK